MNLFFCNNPRVRSSVIFALGEIKDERAGDLITFAFYDEDIKVRKSAIRACAFFPDENRKIYNALMKALQNPLVGSSLRDEMFLFD